MPQALLVVGAIASVGGTIASHRAQRRAAAAQQRQQQLSARRSRRQAIRQAQLTRAQAIASASASGATGSSAALGGQSSIGSQLGEQFGFSTQMSGLSGEISRNISTARTAGALANIGQTAFSFGASTPRGQATLQGLGSNLFPQRAPTRPPQNLVGQVQQAVTF